MSEVAGRWSRVGVGGKTAGTEAAASDEVEPTPSVESVEPISGTFICEGAHFEGTLQLKGDFYIDSEFSGALDTDGKLVVGPSAAIEGDIRAREIVICGAVVGDVFARRQLVLRSTARLHGNIETACLEVEKHAFFRGMTAMTRPQDEARANQKPRKTKAATAAPA